MSDSVDNVKLLLRHGANVNHKDSQGNTAMHLAVMTGNLNVVKLLDQYNADASIENEQGSSAIEISMQLHQRDIRAFFQTNRRYRHLNFQ